MPLAITPLNYLQISRCESTSDGGTWTGNAIGGGIGEIQREGTYCIGATLRAAGFNDVTLTKASGTWDLSGIKHLRIWFMYNNRANLKLLSEGGVQLFVGDAVNTAYWYVAGRLTYPGGWYNLVADLSATPSIGAKPSGMLATKIGVRLDLHTAVAKNVQNAWLDFLILCDGLQCSGTPQYGFATIEAEDAAATGAWGIIRKIAGIFYLTGSLEITTDFKAISQVAVFEDRWVNTALYEIKTTTANGKFQLGDKAGPSGVSGCIVRTEALTQIPKFKITCTDANVTDFKLYGSSFLDAGTISLPLTGANKEVLNCNFEKTGALTLQTMALKYCNFIAYGNRSLGSASLENCSFISGTGLITAGGGLIKNCSIISPTVAVAMLWNINVNPNTKLDGTTFTSSGTGHAIEFGAIAPYDPNEITLTNVTFNNYTGTDANAAVHNNSGHHLIINIIGGTDITSLVRNTGASTTTVNVGLKTYSFTVKNQAGTSLTGYEWHLYEADPTPGRIGTEIVGEEEAASSTQNYQYTSSIDIVIQIIHDGYEEELVYDTLPDTNKSINIILKQEGNI